MERYADIQASAGLFWYMFTTIMDRISLLVCQTSEIGSNPIKSKGYLEKMSLKAATRRWTTDVNGEGFTLVILSLECGNTVWLQSLL